MCEEEEVVAVAGREVEVELEEGGGEEEAVPALADAAGAEEGRWREKGDDSVEDALRQPAPNPAVHPGG